MHMNALLIIAVDYGRTRVKGQGSRLNKDIESPKNNLTVVNVFS